ncbi:MAG: hypothetical protein ACKPEY_04800 [Planctomycetota bacterium]
MAPSLSTRWSVIVAVALAATVAASVLTAEEKAKGAPPGTPERTLRRTAAGPAGDMADERQQLPERLSAVRTRLQAKDTSAATQADQKAIVTLFDRLILASQRAEQGQGGGGGSSNSPRPSSSRTQSPDDPAAKNTESEDKPEEKPEEKPADKPDQQDEDKPAESMADDDSAGGGGPGTRTGRAAGDWGRLRPEEREPVLRALREKFPPRYRTLVDQYFQSFPHAKP